MENIITAIILWMIAISCFIISFLQFKQKGFLFNNAYIYASKKEKGHQPFAFSAGFWGALGL